MKYLSVFIFCRVPGSHVLVIRGCWFMTSSALAVLGLKELPAKNQRKRNLFPVWQAQTSNIWRSKCVHSPPDKYPFLVLLEGRDEIYDLPYIYYCILYIYIQVLQGQHSLALEKVFPRGWGFSMTSEMSWIPSMLVKKAGKPGPFSSCAARSCAEPRDRIMHQALTFARNLSSSGWSGCMLAHIGRNDLI